MRRGGQVLTVVRISMIVQRAHALMEGAVEMSLMDTPVPASLLGLVKSVRKVGT